MADVTIIDPLNILKFLKLFDTINENIAVDCDNTLETHGFYKAQLLTNISGSTQEFLDKCGISGKLKIILHQKHKGCEANASKWLPMAATIGSVHRCRKSVTKAKWQKRFYNGN